MEYKLNLSPHLKMSEITKRLFNRNFHSDVQFNVEGKIIYAHSLELMKRSIVFEQQFEHVANSVTGNSKIIVPIDDYKYEHFFEFIRFIYTDECKITEANGIEILKLAIHYKVIMLENKIINFSESDEWCLKLFEHCVVAKYELVRNLMDELAGSSFSGYLENKHFCTLHPDAVDALLAIEYVSDGVAESEIFTALGTWITIYCNDHQMSLAEGRKQFDNLIRKIRFPTMSIEEIRECCDQFPGLLSQSDRISISEQTIFGPTHDELCPNWISEYRKVYISPYETIAFTGDFIFETRLLAVKDTILHGIRIGNSSPSKVPIETTISTKDGDILAFVLTEFEFCDLTFNLGDALRFKANCEYTITTKYMYTSECDYPETYLKLVCLREGIGPIINDAAKSVEVLEISCNVFEIFFKPPLD